MTGRTISHYEVLEKLGEGGMGVVYQARDTRLDRFVALKVLPAGKVADPERKRRFIQEAKAASALNHPNIVTIHDITQEDGIDFIVMEYIPGKTLDRVISRRGLPLGEALRYAIEIADALAAAHAAGIVHRDLKPFNIMVTDKGRVKILDFGLAKLTEPAPPGEEEATRTIKPHTEDGAVIGTAAYMSPEQAQGFKIDARSDIFSFGAVVYEMITGRQPFATDSKMSTLAAVINQNPKPVNEIVEGVPSDLERVILHCLRKDPARRFQHMDDVKTLLEELKDESDSGKFASAPPMLRPASRWRYPFAASALLLAVAAIFWISRRPPTDPAPRSVKLTRLTSDSGLTWQPALSPDGKLVAYASDRAGDGNLDIWVRQIAGGEPARLTNHAADDYEPTFSPDGSKIAFRSDRDGGGIYVVSTLGGDARLIAKNGHRPRFSPDGDWLAYWTGVRGVANQRRVQIIPSSGGPARQTAATFDATSPIWSPDSKYVLFVGKQQKDTPWDWWAAPMDGGPLVRTGVVDLFPRVPSRWSDIGGSVIEPDQWLADHTVFFSAPWGDSTNLWQVPLSPKNFQATGAPRQITSGAGREIQPSVAANRLLVFANVASNSDVWSLPVDANRGKVAGEILRLTTAASVEESPSISADGTMVAFESDRTGNREVWIKELSSGHEAQLTLSPSGKTNPVLSPDAGRIVYYASAGQRDGLYVLSIREGVAREICKDCGDPSDWSPDGKSVLTYANQSGVIDLVGIESGTVVNLLRHSGYALWNPRFSPDGRWIVFHARTSPAKQQVFVVPVRPGGEWIAITDGSHWDRRPAWSPDGNLLYFASESDGFRCIWAQRLMASKRPDGDPFPVFHVHNARRSLFNVTSADELGLSVGRDKIVFATAEITGNIWMLETPVPTSTLLK